MERLVANKLNYDVESYILMEHFIRMWTLLKVKLEYCPTLNTETKGM